jgi:hypothetical protein
MSGEIKRASSLHRLPALVSSIHSAVRATVRLKAQDAIAVNPKPLTSEPYKASIFEECTPDVQHEAFIIAAESFQVGCMACCYGGMRIEGLSDHYVGSRSAIRLAFMCVACRPLTRYRTSSCVVTYAEAAKKPWQPSSKMCAHTMICELRDQG